MPLAGLRILRPAERCIRPSIGNCFLASELGRSLFMHQKALPLQCRIINFAIGVLPSRSSRSILFLPFRSWLPLGNWRKG